MSLLTQTSFTRDQLFADLEIDGITLDASIINNAKNGNSNAMYSIGIEYDTKKRKYDKAMAWYRLAAVKNNWKAQNNIGVLYGNGLGVPQDYLLALEWYLKAATQNNKHAWGNIGLYFESGRGVPVNKYKALEWYTKSEEKPKKVKALTEQDIRLTEQDKNKPIEQLIVETEDIIYAARKKREDEGQEELSSLKLLNTQIEEQLRAKDDKIKSLEEENQTQRLDLDQKQKEINDQRGSIEQHKRENENEISSLKMTNAIQASQLESKDNHIKSLEKAIESMGMAFQAPLQNTIRSVGEIEKSSQFFERLLEQERRLKDNEIMLLKQEMEASLNKEKNLKRRIEAESEAMRNELKRMKSSSEIANLTGDDNSNNHESDSENINNENDGNGDSDKLVKIESV